jgi:hypothetical protein
MDPRFTPLLQQQLTSGFADLAGARVSATIPVSERLINEVIVRGLPPRSPVHDVHVRPRDGNRFDVKLKLARPAFLPPISITAVIERQPDMPHSPVLGLRLSSLPGLMSVAGFGAGFLNVLPPGIKMEGDRLHVDLAALIGEHAMRVVLPFIERLNVTTVEGQLVVELDARVRRS